jgi:hypothetical protein
MANFGETHAVSSLYSHSRIEKNLFLPFESTLTKGSFSHRNYFFISHILSGKGLRIQFGAPKTKGMRFTKGTGRYSDFSPYVR